jgi:hypothetical protein
MCARIERLAGNRMWRSGHARFVLTTHPLLDVRTSAQPSSLLNGKLKHQLERELNGAGTTDLIQGIECAASRSSPKSTAIEVLS